MPVRLRTISGAPQPIDAPHRNTAMPASAPSGGVSAAAPKPSLRVAGSSTFTRLLAENRERARRRRDLAAQLAEAGKPQRFYRPDGHSALAQADMSNPGGFRLTYFDGKGPSGHVEHLTLLEAIDTALQSGYLPVDRALPRPSPATATDAELLSLGLRARRFLESRWIGDLTDPWGERLQVPLSMGMCRYSAEFMARIASDIGLSGWSVHGGEAGFLASVGNSVPHFWLSDGYRIIDITADQFPGMPPVYAGRPDPSRYIEWRPALPPSPEAAHSLSICDEWAKDWRADGGEPQAGSASEHAFLALLDDKAAAMALVLHEGGGLPLCIVGEAAGRPLPIAGIIGQHAYTAAGYWGDWAQLAAHHNVQPEDAREVSREQMEVAFGLIPTDDLRMASTHAAAFPPLFELLRQAMYADPEHLADDGTNEDETPIPW